MKTTTIESTYETNAPCACASWCFRAGDSRRGPRRRRGRASVVAIRGGTVLTVTRGTIQNGTVVLRDGKIAAVGGPNTAIPAGADIVDATGRFVTPGIIDAHSHIAADSINEGGTTVSSMTGIEDVLDPTDINIYRDLAGGLTAANVLHGSANPIGGKNAVIKLRWGKTRPSELVFEGAMPGIKFALGENPKDMRQFGGRSHRRRGAIPTTRPGVEFVIRDAFSRAKAYQQRVAGLRTAQKAGDRTRCAPRRDLQLEPLVEILEGKRLVHAHCYRADEILMLIRVADEMGFKIATFQHVLEGYKVADGDCRARRRRIDVLRLVGLQGRSRRRDSLQRRDHAQASGVLVSINSDSAEHARRLNTEAAKSMHWGGLTEDEALALVTINPAKQLRIDNRVGSLEVGKDADVVDLEQASAQHLRDRRSRLHRRPAVLRPAGRRAPADRRCGRKSRELAAAERARGTDDGLRKPRPADAERRGDRDHGESRLQARQRATPAAPASAAASRPQLARSSAITNARIHPITQPTIERGTIVIRGNRIEALGANVHGAGRRAGDRRQGRRCLSRLHRRADDARAQRAGRARLRRHQRDARHQRRSCGTASPTRPTATPFRVARVNGITTVARRAGRRADRRPGRGHESRRLDVGGSDAAPEAGIAFQFPTLRRRRRGGGGGGRGGAPQEPQRTYERSEARTRSRGSTKSIDCSTSARAYAKAGAGQDRRLDARSARAGRRAAAAAVRPRPTANGTSATPSRLPIARSVKIVITGGLEAPSSRRCSRRRTSRSFSGTCSRCRRAKTASTPPPIARRRAGAGRREVRVLERRQHQRPAAALPGRDLGRVGSRSRRGAAGAHDRCRRNPRRRRSRRQPRGRQGCQPVHRQRRSAGDSTPSHPRDHRRHATSAPTTST